MRPVAPRCSGRWGATDRAHGPGFDAARTDSGFAALRRDGTSLHLTLASDDDWRERTPVVGRSPVVSGGESFLAGTGACLIEVHGVDELYDAVRPLGVVHPNASIEDTPWGTREFGLVDPDGNLVTVFERIDPPT